jgi:hypothetical protein
MDGVIGDFVSGLREVDFPGLPTLAVLVAAGVDEEGGPDLSRVEKGNRVVELRHHGIVKLKRDSGLGSVLEFEDFGLS